MKMIIIKIIVILVAIISVAAVVALFTKKKYTITRDITINKPKQQVFDFIKLNKNQMLYNKWLLLDPTTKIEMKGATDGNPGSVLCFESNNHKTGKGEWEIKKITEGERVDFELRFLSPFVFTANGDIVTEAVSPNQTKLKWVYHSGMDWPKNFMLLLMDMEKVVGTDLAETLGNIKTITEKN